MSVAAAKLELEQAESELAEARLHRAQAQAVADSGGWVDVARFDESVSQSKAKVDAATKALAQAESMAVLALQGS